ncbi:hypothetical protein D9M68_956810 [compost metagenome]
MGDACADACGFCGADFCRGNGQRREPRTGFREGRLGRDAGGGSLLSEHCKLLLNGLERTNCLAELLAFTGIVGGHVQ